MLIRPNPNLSTSFSQKTLLFKATTKLQKIGSKSKGLLARSKNSTLENEIKHYFLIRVVQNTRVQDMKKKNLKQRIVFSMKTNKTDYRSIEYLKVDKVSVPKKHKKCKTNIP